MEDTNHHTNNYNTTASSSSSSAYSYTFASAKTNENAGNNEPPCCRICHCGEEEAATLGRLFRPCQCTGSVRYVHIQCLNRWRRMSANPESYWKCDQCGFRYKVARSKLADQLQSTLVLQAVTAAVFLVWILLTGVLFRLLTLDQYVYGMLLMEPWGKDLWILDLLSSGVVGVGVLGFCFRLLQVYRERSANGVAPIGIFVIANGQITIRFFVLVGVLYYLQFAYNSVKDFIVAQMQKHGEVILEVE